LLSRLSCALQHHPLARALGMKSARLRDVVFLVYPPASSSRIPARLGSPSPKYAQ
jgi:hypothetical protein